MDVDELPASILNLSNDVWTILTPCLSSYEIYNLMTTSPAMMSRMRHSVRELEVCTSFRSMNKFPSNFVSQFSALKHLIIGLADPHPEYDIEGLDLSLLPSTLVTLEARNDKVLELLFGLGADPSNQSHYPVLTSDGSIPHLPRLEHLIIELWETTTTEDLEWVYEVLSLPQLSCLYVPTPWIRVNDILGGIFTSLVQLDITLNPYEDVDAVFELLPPALTHLSISTDADLPSAGCELLPSSLVYLRIEDNTDTLKWIDFFSSPLPLNLESLEISYTMRCLPPTKYENVFRSLPHNLTSLKMSEPATEVIYPSQWHMLPKSLTNFPLRLRDDEPLFSHHQDDDLAAFRNARNNRESIRSDFHAFISDLPTALKQARIAMPLPHHILSLPCLNALTCLTICYPPIDLKPDVSEVSSALIALSSLPVLDALTVEFEDDSYFPDVPLGHIMSHFTHPLTKVSFQNVWFHPLHIEFDFTQIWAKRLRVFRLDRSIGYMESQEVLIAEEDLDVTMEQIPIESVSNDFLSSLPHSMLELSLTLANFDDVHGALESCPPYLTSLALGAADVSEFYVNSPHLTNLRIIHNGASVLKHITIECMLDYVGEHMVTLYLHNIELSYAGIGCPGNQLPALAYHGDEDLEDAQDLHIIEDLDGIDLERSEEDKADRFLLNFSDYCEDPMLRDRYGVEMFDYSFPPTVDPVLALIEERCPNLRLLQHGGFVEKIYKMPFT